MINIVLYEPEIPSNTGNIARTCVVTGSPLHLIKPLGFSIDDKYLKRAGLDYWDLLDLHVYEDFDDFLNQNATIENGQSKLFILSTQGDKTLNDFEVPDGSYLLFGNETSGLDSKIHEKFSENRFRIPMVDNNRCRCLNLSNSVAVALYEALRQHDFFDLV